MSKRIGRLFQKDDQYKAQTERHTGAYFGYVRIDGQAVTT